MEAMVGRCTIERAHSLLKVPLLGRGRVPRLQQGPDGMQSRIRDCCLGRIWRKMMVRYAAEDISSILKYVRLFCRDSFDDASWFHEVPHSSTLGSNWSFQVFADLLKET